MTGYEAAHGDLRAAEEATRGATLGMSVTHVAAAEALWKFHERTGPLVDDLVAAVRQSTERTESWLQVPVSVELEFRLKLAALDEAARG